MGEKAVFSLQAHVFQIDPETKKKWLPSSTAAVRVAYYHDPGKKTYRIIAIENNKALVNSTITANMNFTKTSPKFGQWSDHRANTVYGLGFSAEKDLERFVEKFSEAKAAAKVLLEERKRETQIAQEQDKPQLPAGTSPITSPAAVNSPPPSSPPDSTHYQGGAGRKVSSGSLVNGTSSSGEESVLRMPNGPPATQESSPAIGRSGTNATPEAELESLKYENSRLKVALASSAQNVKKWETEMQTLKNNNTRLTTALEESTQHVAEWKKQLQKYKEESDSLKKKVQEMEGARHAHSSQAMEEMEAVKRENEELKEVLSAVQLDLEAKTEECQRRATEVESLEQQVEGANTRIEALEEDVRRASEQVSLLEDQLKMASVASQQKMGDMQQRHRELGHKLQEVARLHKELMSHLDV